MSEETKDFPNKITDLDNLYNQINELVPGCEPWIPVQNALEFIIAEIRRLKEIELMFSDHKEFKCSLTAKVVEALKSMRDRIPSKAIPNDSDEIDMDGEYEWLLCSMWVEEQIEEILENLKCEK